MDTKSYQGKKVLVIGLGVSGRSAARYLVDRGAHVLGVDGDRDLLNGNQEIQELRQKGLHTFHETEQRNIDDCDFVVVSPGVPQDNAWYSSARNACKEVIGEIELACRHLTQPFIGITGTNGKTTVSLLVGEVLGQSGKPARVLGNAGIPLTSEISGLQDEIIVCELSSYQLETMQSKVIDVGVITNVTPDHLDRYPSLEEYAAAKIRMRHCLKPGAPLYVEQATVDRYQTHFGAFKPKTFGYTEDCDIFTDKTTVFNKENIEFLLPIPYRNKTSHDLENIMAAFAVCCEMGVEPEDFGRVLATFKKPPHRIEFVRKFKGVHFYNDSKGTNIDAVIRAVESMDGQVVLIAGGLDKGTSYASWLEAFKEKVKCICAIGQAKEKIYEELSPEFRIKTCNSLESAIKYASTIAKEGEHVLLSPGCASFDMFDNYEHRGEEFKRIVQVL
ncbi:MAG: UDP-N-acetylmuramoylalanine--D-glutamate ligase [Chlamydiae bacterium]|nr:UDP-N-acetylmuramoylalanine--D-glutamate ligase [Chlamydiota bacterium]